MQGTIENAGKEYWWWAGPANDGAMEGYCVHCRNTVYGVTKYIDEEPSEQQAREVAAALIPKLGEL